MSYFSPSKYEISYTQEELFSISLRTYFNEENILLEEKGWFGRHMNL